MNNEELSEEENRYLELIRVLEVRHKAYLNFMDNPDRWDDMQEYERWEEENHRT